MPRSLLISSLLLSLTPWLVGQKVYEKGTFVSYPAGKHVNHSFYSDWNAYFAVEDGVLVYDHHKRRWLEPITASNGLEQYPVLLVWHHSATQDVWMVTPDFIFIYDELSDWMTKIPLPRDPRFAGSYELGLNDQHVIVSTRSADGLERYSALFSISAQTFESWGLNENLDISWDNVQWLSSVDPALDPLLESLPVQSLRGGSFDSDGNIHLDGHPRNSLGRISSLVGAGNLGEAFLSTYGMGIFHQQLPGGEFVQLPYGLLSPDVMALARHQGRLLIGGRAGVTFMDSSGFSYDEAIREISFDYSFVSDIDASGSGLIIAGKGGVFADKQGKGSWTRLASKKDLLSDKIYAVASGRDGLLMIGTEKNAFLYHESGLVLESLFPRGLNWPVFDVLYHDDLFYLSTYYGLYVYDAVSQGFVAKISSNGDLLSPATQAAIDPIYETRIALNKVWSTTHRGIMMHNLASRKGTLHLSPNTPFKPRGLDVTKRGVWIGTDIGLYSFDIKSSSWRHYTETDGLISNFVTELLADETYIWVGTNLGLTRLKWKNLY